MAGHQVINALSYQPLGTDGGNNVAYVAVDASVASLWDISLIGTPSGNDSARNIVPQFILVDNLANNQNATISFGTVSLTVPAFERESIPIPSGVRNISVSVYVGVTNIYISEQLLANDQNNSLLIQQTAVKTMIYSFVSYNGNATQQTSDQNSSITFSPNAAMTYTLLPISTTPIGNGWFQFLYNESIYNVTIKPAGPDIIDFGGTVWSNAAPLVLAPGASGYLANDGVYWHFGGVDFNPVGVAPIRNGAALNNGPKVQRHFGDVYWSGQAGQPSWVLGSNDGISWYVYNPANFAFQDIQASNIFTVGTLMYGVQLSGAACANGAATGGATLHTVIFNPSPGTGGVQTGTWVNLSGISVNSGAGGAFVRTA